MSDRQEIGGNNPPPPIEDFKVRVAKYIADAASFATITEANENLAADHLNLGISLAAEIETQRTTEKRPHLDANTQIDLTYKPVHDKVEGERVALRNRLTVHAKAKKDAAEKKAREAAQALADAQEAARLAAEAPAEEDPFLAATAPAGPDLAVLTADAKVAELQTKTATRVSAASGGRTFAVRASPKRAEITDAKALAAYLIDAKHIDMTDLLQRLANANARAKGAIAWPGTKIVEGD